MTMMMGKYDLPPTIRTNHNLVLPRSASDDDDSDDRDGDRDGEDNIHLG